MKDGSDCVLAIALPSVMSELPVRMSAIENTASGKEDGLKMCAERPSFSHRMSSLARYPTGIIANCQ